LFARELRRRRPRPTSRWHLDEMSVIIGGRQFWLWCAVDERRRGSRSARSATARQGCSGETDAQAAQETRLLARGAGDRQAALLWRSKVGNEIVCSGTTPRSHPCSAPRPRRHPYSAPDKFSTTLSRAARWRPVKGR
jgi:hypothetical protein